MEKGDDCEDMLAISDFYTICSLGKLTMASNVRVGVNETSQRRNSGL